jgi:hypothetical protein
MNSSLNTHCERIPHPDVVSEQNYKLFLLPNA